MSAIAYALIKERALRPADRARFREAYDEAWNSLKGRVGGDAEFVQRLAALIVSVGNRRPEADASDIARIVANTYIVPSEQE